MKKILKAITLSLAATGVLYLILGRPALRQGEPGPGDDDRLPGEIDAEDLSAEAKEELLAELGGHV